MGYKLPCLVSDIRPYREMIREEVEGFLFQSDDFSNFMGKLGELLESPEKLENIGENARRKVEKEYNWDEVVRKTEGIYQELV